jgi:hypothetical protein
VPAATITNDLAIEGEALVWRLSGIRPSSGQTHKKRNGKRVATKGSGHPMAVARERKNDRERWQALLLSAKSRSEVAGWIRPAPAQIRIAVWGPSLPDSPNVAWHAKYAVDALVSLGFLPDDSPKYVPRTIADSLLERPEWAPKGVGIEIRIERAAA